MFSAKRAEDVPKIQETLTILADIPHVRYLEVGRNMKADRSSSEVDVILYSEFDDENALEAFKQHPLYQESTRRVRPLRETRIVADWDKNAALPSRNKDGRGG